MNPPRGLVGALGGALGTLTAIPILAGIAIHLSPLAELPGAERLTRDAKAATYVEAAVFLVVVPVSAFVFGYWLPRLLEAWSGPGPISFEWVGAAFATSLLFAQSGLRPRFALIAGSMAAAATALALGCASVQRLLTTRTWGCSAALLVLAGASLDLARRSGPGTSRNVFDSLLGELIVAGVVLAVAAGALCLTLAHTPSQSFRQLAQAAWAPLLAAALVILSQRGARLLLPAGLLALAVAAASPHSEQLSRRLTRTALVLLLVVCARAKFSTVWFEYFESGHSLSAAQSYLSGARAYIDVVPIHGWGADGGGDAFLFRLFGATARTFLWREMAGSILAFALLIAICLAALPPPWGGLAALFSLGVCPNPFGRQALAFAALLLLVRGIRSRSTIGVAVAGALAAWQVFYSLDYGLIVLLAGVFSLTALSFIRLPDQDGNGFNGRFPLAFAAGAACGAGPFLAVLSARGALRLFLRTSFLETPRWADAVWGLPAGSAWSALSPARDLPSALDAVSGAGMKSLFFLLLLAVVGSTLLLRIAQRSFEQTDRVALIVLSAAALALRGVLGRADDPHLERYAVFAGVPAAWLLMRAWQNRRMRGALTTATSLFLLLRLHPIKALAFQLESVERAARRTGPQEAPPRSGGARVPAGAAAALRTLRAYMDANLRPGETFFDFDNQPALYFYTDRRPPLRFMTVAQYESPERQREVLESLERVSPPVAILPAATYGSFDGVSNADRAPLVADYLATHYGAPEQVGDWLLAPRRASPGVRAVR